MRVVLRDRQTWVYFLFRRLLPRIRSIADSGTHPLSSPLRPAYCLAGYAAPWPISSVDPASGSC